jgi:hypothetical protein
MPTHPGSQALREIEDARQRLMEFRKDYSFYGILARQLLLAGLGVWLAALHLENMDRTERIEVARELDRMRREFPSRRARLMLRASQLSFPTYY